MGLSSSRAMACASTSFDSSKISVFGVSVHSCHPLKGRSGGMCHQASASEGSHVSCIGVRRHTMIVTAVANPATRRPARMRNRLERYHFGLALLMARILVLLL